MHIDFSFSNSIHSKFNSSLSISNSSHSSNSISNSSIKNKKFNNEFYVELGVKFIENSTSISTAKNIFFYNKLDVKTHQRDKLNVECIEFDSRFDRKIFVSNYPDLKIFYFLLIVLILCTFFVLYLPYIFF